MQKEKKEVLGMKQVKAYECQKIKCLLLIMFNHPYSEILSINKG